jgi:heptosyltransferase III
VNRILVIRGGAIGDFVLTLPALKALRDTYAETHIEILGYKHIAALAENRFYAQAVRSIEYGPLSSFFAKHSKLPADLSNYFASFHLIISYLYDPDEIFEQNLRACGVQNLIRGPAKISNSATASQQLGKPVEELGIRVGDLVPKIFPSPEDRQFAGDFLRNLPPPILAIHPGSGSEQKNWPVTNWIKLGNDVLAQKSFRGSMLVISGEADRAQVEQLEELWKNERVAFAKNLPLVHVAALLEDSIFIGHDSGISHVAAAAGAKCILLFGPTDPQVWAPRNENAHIIRAKSGVMEDIGIALVEGAIAASLCEA